ncbi:hypothetical protein ACP4OV_028131 [Aristida adscensionis]
MTIDNKQRLSYNAALCSAQPCQRLIKPGHMEMILSAFLGEVAQRSISFFIERLSGEAASSLPSDEHLRRKLLRIRAIVEEAEGRQIKNQAMLEQLRVLQAGMYKGYYVLDSFKCRAHQEQDDHGVSHSFTLSKFNPAKRVQLCGASSSHGGEKELRQVICYLEMIVTDASEFVILIKGCPPLLYNRPYSTYLIMENCMFARHVEMEHIINFLMQKGSPGTVDLDVMPIVGPAKAGKSTLIEHVCNDDDLDERLVSIRDGGVVKHQSYGGSGTTNERVLVIFQVNGDVDNASWSSLYSASKRYAANGSKIIISSWSDKIARFGTTQTLKVGFPTNEEYWYFFKALAFGSTNPEEEPKLASMAMEIADGLFGSFIAGNVMARMLRANFNVKFWTIALSCVKEINRRYRFMFGSHPITPSQKRKQLRILNGANEFCSIIDDYQIVSDRDKAPMITMQEVMSGTTVPYGKFDVLAWRSSIPPYHSYRVTCEIGMASRLDIQNRRNPKNHR